MSPWFGKLAMSGLEASAVTVNNCRFSRFPVQPPERCGAGACGFDGESFGLPGLARLSACWVSGGRLGSQLKLIPRFIGHAMNSQELIQLGVEICQLGVDVFLEAV